MENLNENQIKAFDGSEVKKYYKNQTDHLNVPEGEVWTDTLFSHDEFALHSKEYRENKKSFYPEQLEFIKNEIKVDKVEFKRAMDVYKEDHYYVFEDTIDVNDIMQGAFSDCYFLSAVASLTEFPQFIFSKFLTKVPNSKGYYEVILFIDGEWQIVVVDDYFPFAKGTKSYAFTGSHNNELWVLLLEKAWAKVNGGYSNIVLGHVSDAFQALTGFSYEHVKDITIFTQDELWEKVKKSDDIGYIMCTGTKNEKFVTNYGLVQGHAYTLISAKEKNDKVKNIRLLRLFNPWGRQEWTGDWSDHSPLWDKELADFFLKKEEDDGLFFMDLASYPSYYESLYICHMMYDSVITSYQVPSDQSKKPLFFNFDVQEDTDAKISVFLKHWRFNRDILGIERPTSLVLARINEAGEVDFLKGQFTLKEDIHFIQRLEKGRYIAWVYSVVQEIDNPYTLRFAAEKAYTSHFIGEDAKFEVINYLIGQHKKYELDNDPTANKSAFVLDNDLTLKSAGIFSYVAINYDKKNTMDLIITPGDISPFFSMIAVGADKKAKVTLTCNDIFVFSVIRNTESEEVFKITNKRDRSRVKNKTPNTFEEVKAFIAGKVENPPFDTFKYRFPAKNDLSIKKYFEKKGQVIKDKYYEKDLLEENKFIAEEIIKHFNEKGETPEYWLEKNSEGYYMGQKKIENNLYYGAKFYEGSKDYYIGWFRDDLFYQEGRYFKNNKLYYKGDYKNGKMHGYGVLFSENRDIFRGSFVDGRKKGLHRIYHENTNSLTICFMDNDKRYGYALEVNYPQRTTRIAFYKDDNLYNFLVIEYEPFFKAVFNEDYFLCADPIKTYPHYLSNFETKLRERLPCDNLDDLLLKRIHMEKKENKDTRKYDPFMYDMLRDLTANYYTLIDILQDHEGNMYMQTREKTDKVYRLNDLQCYVFFLGITNEKPLYDKAVRWIVFGLDQVLKYVGGYNPTINARYYEANGSGRYLHALQDGIAYYYFPERGCSFGDYSFKEGDQVFETYYFSGFQNNYVHIKQVEDDKKRKEKEEKEKKDGEDNEDDDDEDKKKKKRKNRKQEEEEKIEENQEVQNEDGEENVNTRPVEKKEEKKKGPNLDEITGKRYDYFIPKKEVEELHMEKLYTRELYKKENLKGKEDDRYKQIFCELLRKYYPFFYTLPAGKASDDDEKFDWLKFEIEYNKYVDKVLTLQILHSTVPVIEYYDIKKDNVIEEKLVSRSVIFEKAIGTHNTNNGKQFYHGAIREFKRHGKGIERFLLENDQEKHMHMIYNKKERDSYNLQWIFGDNSTCESYYYNDGFRCSESLNLDMLEKQNVIGKNEEPEERKERRRFNDVKIMNKMYKVYLKPEEYVARGLDKVEGINYRKTTTKEKLLKWPVKAEPDKRPVGIEIDSEFTNLKELYSMYEKPAFLLDLLLTVINPSGHPHLNWTWKHMINGFYLGEVDPFDQCCGRGLMIYTSYSRNQGAYLGYWDADVRHGSGITINLKKKRFYCCNFYIDEEMTNDEREVQKEIYDKLVEEGFQYRQRRDYSDEIDKPEVFIEHDTEDGNPLVLEDKLEVLQLFAGKDDDVIKPINLVSVEEDPNAPKSSSKNINIVEIFELVNSISKKFVKE